jgi:hypothetical protein
MKKIKIIIAAVISMNIASCGLKSEEVIEKSKYTIVDTTYVSKNGFGNVLEYDVIILNHYDSCFHAGSITPEGRLIRYNVKPLKLK